MDGSITESANEIDRSICSDFSGQADILPVRKSCRGLFVRAPGSVLPPKILESAETLKPLVAPVLGFEWLADLADNVSAWEYVNELPEELPENKLP